MGLEIYNLVVSIIGELPIELHFLYGVGTLFLFVLICFCVMLPFSIVYKIWGD